MSYEFTNNWFQQTAKAGWDYFIPRTTVTNALEIGSYEGASTTYLINVIAPRNPFSLTVVDTWEGGTEHKAHGDDMDAVYRRYRRNMDQAMSDHPGKVNYREMRMTSLKAMTKLLDEGKEGAFDFVYIDGSHDPKDVILDAVLGFRLLKSGGVIVFDDYVWAPNAVENTHIQEAPKLAIDAFTHLFWGKYRFIPVAVHQLVLAKT